MGNFSTAVTYAGLTMTAASSLHQISGWSKTMLWVAVCCLATGTVFELCRASKKPRN